MFDASTSLDTSLPLRHDWFNLECIVNLNYSSELDDRELRNEMSIDFPCKGIGNAIAHESYVKLKLPERRT